MSNTKNEANEPDTAVAAEEQATEEQAGAQADEQTERLQQELDTLRDKVMRQAAEFQNYRRRTDQEKARLAEFGRGEVVARLLDVYDDFRRSLESAEQSEETQDLLAAYQSLKEGVELVYRKFSDELGKLGVEAIEAEGAPFDENMHEALMQQPAPEGVEPGTVLTEVQRGYRLGERVLRHSKVIVAA